MMSKHYFAFALAAGFSLLGITGTGCGNGSGNTGGTGGTGGATTSSHSTTSVASTTSTGTMMGGNHDFSTANDIGVDMQATAATLQDAMTKDFYKFMAKKGDRMVIGTVAQLAQSGATGDDNTIIDTVVTVYDSNKNPIAQDDDSWPRFSRDSQLYFEAPADGEYYLSVEDCNSYAMGNSAISCADSTMLVTFDYQVFVLHTASSGFPESNAGTTQDGTTAKATAVTYKLPSGAMAGAYGSYVFDGNFSATGTAAGSTHVYSFTPPADTAVDMGQRARAEFFLQPVGVNNGDGSTSNVKLWITKADGTTVIAAADQNNYKDGDNATDGPLELSVPVTVGNQYFLFVQNTAASSKPDSDYYFIQHFVGSFQYGLTEAEGASGTLMNDTALTAETLKNVGTGNSAFAVDGNIAAVTDVDYFKMAVPTAAKTAYLECHAARAGSGVTGFTAELYDATGVTKLGGGAENIMADQVYATINLTGAPANVLLKVAATGASATNTGTYYLCFTAFQ